MKKLLQYGIGPLIGLTGISLALYFHYESIQERVPTYYVSPERIRIVDRGSAPSDLEVLYRGTPIRATNVAAIVIYFWNDGRLPIRSSDILEPITITLSPGSEILEARVVKQSRNVIKFSRGEVAESARNVLPISFQILEQFDGAAIQLTYAGDPNAKVSLTGTIVGAGAPKLLPSHNVEITKPESNREIRIPGFITMGLGLLMTGCKRIRVVEGQKASAPGFA